MPLHPKAKEIAKSGLFAGISSFEDLEKRIAAISLNHANNGKGIPSRRLPEIGWRISSYTWLR